MPTSRFDLTALLETSRLLASSLELDFVLGSLLLTAMSKTLVPRAAVLLDDPLAGGLRVAAAKGRFPDDRLAPGALLPPEAARTLPEGLSLALPIVYHERTIGHVALGPKATGESFSGDERAFLDSLVQMSASAVHNARMVEELRLANQDLGRTVQQLHTLFDLAQAFSRTLDEERVARQLALTLMGQFLVRRFAVLLRPESNGAESGGEPAPLECVAARPEPLPAALTASLESLPRATLLDDDAPEALAPLAEAGFALALPLRLGDAVRGVLLLGPPGRGRSYSADDLDFLSALGQLSLTAVENARGVAARLERERLEEELRTARRIQERLLPHALPSPDGAELAALNLASRTVAGDYYEALRLADGRLLLAVADVSGKGLPAAMLAANLQAALHVLADSIAAGTLDLPAATARLNRVIHRNTSMTTFITFFWGLFDPASGAFDYVNAGHNAPMLLRADGALDLLETGGILLGVLPETPFELGTTTLGTGDALALYTDGITEAWNPEAEDDLFGEERFEAILRSHRDEPAEAVCTAIREAVREHTHDGPLDDDFTLLVLRRTA